MNSSRPKFLKAILFNNNMAEVGGSIIQNQCFTLQDYHYHCYRERNEKGEPYGGFLSEYLTFSIILSDPYACKFFYQCMDRNEYLPFSFIFNASSALETTGFVFGIKTTVPNPPATAALSPVSKSSF